MGTRLYPGTDEVAVLEELLGLPAGTGARLQSLQERYAGDGQGLFDALGRDAEAQALYDFQLFGWGKLRSPVYRELERLGLDPVCGHVEDVELAWYLLELQGVAGEIPTSMRTRFGATKGVMWS